MSAPHRRPDPSRHDRSRSALEAASPSEQAQPGGLQRALPRLLGVVLLTLLGLYVARVAGLVVTLQRAAMAEAGLSDEVDALRTEVAGLETAAVDAQSDAFVERWAREERTMSRPGDRTIEVVETAPESEQPVERGDGLLLRLRRLFGAEDGPEPDREGLENDATPPAP